MDTTPASSPAIPTPTIIEPLEPTGHDPMTPVIVTPVLPTAEAAADAKIEAWFQKWFHGHGSKLTVELYNWFYEKRAEMYAEFSHADE